MSDTEPRAWVGCLACYSEGRLTGEWVDGVDAGEFVPCRRAGHEEWWVLDHEGTHGLIAGECSPVEFSRAAEVLAELEDDETREAFAVYVREVASSGPLDVSLASFREEYRGRFDSDADYAQEQIADLYESALDALPDVISIDWESTALAMDANGWFMSVRASGGGVFVFRE